MQTMTRKTISEILPEGIIFVMNHINAERVSQLFANETEIADFDLDFLGKHGERNASHYLLYCAENNKIDGMASAILSRFFNSWLRVKQTLESEYDYLKPAGVTSTITEKKDENRNEENSDNTQKALNAFNSDVASDTERETKSGNLVETIGYAKTTTRETKQNYGQWTGSELTKQEIEFRNKIKFFEIVSNDIAQEICAGVY